MMDSPQPLPDRIGNYRLIRVLGEGGMGTVFLAEQDKPIVRRVALKLIKLGMDSSAIIARFERERQALALMDHEGIAKVFDCGTSDTGRPYFVMEYAPGLPIDQYCRKRRLSLAQRLALMRQVCAAVQHAHQKSIVHRDLKPGNILVNDADGQPRIKVIDFGLAKALAGRLSNATLFTEIGQIMGTPSYMAPEQAQTDNQDIDTRADVYALGVILYELLVGELPFSPETLRIGGLAGVQRILSEVDPPRPSSRITKASKRVAEAALTHGTSQSALRKALQNDLDWVVLKALAKERDRRYDSPGALAADLQRFLEHEPVMAGPPGTGYRLRKLLRRYRSQAIAIGVLMVAIVAGSFATLAQYFRAEDKALEAQANLTQVERLLDFAAAELLTDRERELYPATPDMAGPMRTWLADVDDVLLRFAGYQAEAAAILDDSDIATIELRTAVRNLEQLARLRPRVATRLELASTLTAVSIEAEATTWAAARQRIAASDRYQGAQVRPQTGLVPLGPNEQGYEEFWHVASGARPVRDGDGKLIITEPTGIVMVLTPGTLFADGSRVPFFLGKFEVTQSQWQRVMGSTPSLYRPPAALVQIASAPPRETPITVLHPVESVSWDDCATLAARLDLRLPTEAEWEHAAKAGSGNEYHWGREPTDLAMNENMLDLSHTQHAVRQGGLGVDDGYPLHAPVGSFARNAFGFCDMLGNVAEWCQDLHTSNNPIDREPWRRTFRGGNWYSPARYAHVEQRQYANPRTLNQTIGLRLARDVRN